MSKQPISSSSSGGIGLFSATFLVFLVLKLTGYIDWSWWWITAPLWGIVVLFVAIVLVFFLVSLVLEVNEQTGNK